MVNKKIIGIMVLLGIVFFTHTSCPLVYPGGGSVTFIGQNNATPLVVGQVNIALTGITNNESYDTSSSFGPGGFFTSIPWVQPGSYTLRISVADTSGESLASVTGDFWITDGEQKAVNFSIDQTVEGPQVVIGSISSGAGGSGVSLDQSGAGYVWRLHGEVAPYALESYSLVGGSGNLDNITLVEAVFPDGITASYGRTNRSLQNISVVTDYSWFVGFTRGNFFETGFFSLSLSDILGNKAQREYFRLPTWSTGGENAGRFESVAETFDGSDWYLNVYYELPDNTDVAELLFIATYPYDEQHVADIRVVGFPGQGTLEQEFYGLPTSSSFNFTLVTADAPIPQDFKDSLWGRSISPDRLALELLIWPDGPDQIGLHQYYYPGP